MHLPMDSDRHYTTNTPWLIEIWFDKAPIMFLIISALMFVVGLNLFAYLSSQVRTPSARRITMLTIFRLPSCHYQQVHSLARIVYAYLW